MGFIPGLLMLATFALERLEAGLSRDTVSTSDVDDFLERSGARAVREKTPVASGAGHRPLHDRFDPVEALPTRAADTPLPTHIYIPHQPNTQFHATRHPDPV
ncbi:hypothetical protein [Mycobacterium sp. PS03-16]|uniref:hypothetical protein n=1 Tax=Mycobacterium sp. PS03-16 TaxID=2559611 RepID=UPI0035286AD2